MKTFVKIILFTFSLLLSSNLYCQTAKDFKIDTIIDFGIVYYDTVKTNMDKSNNHFYDRTRKIKIPLKKIRINELERSCRIYNQEESKFCADFENHYISIKPDYIGNINIECLHCMENYENIIGISTDSNSSQYFHIRGKFKLMPHILELESYNPVIIGNDRLYENSDTIIYFEVHNVSKNETIHICDFESETPLTVLDTSITIKPGERKKIRILVHPLIPDYINSNLYHYLSKIRFTASGSYLENIIVNYSMIVFKKRDIVIIKLNKPNKQDNQNYIQIPSAHYPAASFFFRNPFCYIYPNPENLVISTTAPFSVYKYTKGDSIFFYISIEPLYNDTLSIEHFLDNYKTVRTLIIDTSTNKILHTIEQKFEVLPALALKYNFKKETDTLVSARFCLGWKTEAGQMASRPIREHFSAHITDSIDNFVYFDSFSKKTAFFDGWNDCQNCNCNKILFNNSVINKALHIKIDNFTYPTYESAINYVYKKRLLFPLTKPVYVFIIKPEIE